MAKLPVIAGSAPAVGRASAETPAAAPASATEFLGQLIEALQPSAPSGIVTPGAATPAQAGSNASPAIGACTDPPAPQAGGAHLPAASNTDAVPTTSPASPPGATLLPPSPQRSGGAAPRCGSRASKPDDKTVEKSQAGTPIPVATMPAMLPVPTPPLATHSLAVESFKHDVTYAAGAAPPTSPVATIASAASMLAQPANDGSVQAHPSKKMPVAEPADTTHRIGPEAMTMVSPGQSFQARSTDGATRPGPSPASAPAPAAPASPSTQLGAALHTLATAPDGTQQISLQLHPIELGHVAVQIVQPKDGPASVQITVERPETMQLLMHDQPQLQRTLDQAGLPGAGRVVSYALASPVGQPAGAGIADPGVGGRQREGGFRRRRSGHAQEFTIAPGGSAWQRTGIDITA